MTILRLINKQQLRDKNFHLEWTNDYIELNSYTIYRKETPCPRSLCIKKTELLVLSAESLFIIPLVNKLRSKKYYFESLIYPMGLNGLQHDINLIRENHCNDDCNETDFNLGFNPKDEGFADEAFNFLRDAFERRTLILAPRTWINEVNQQETLIREMLGFYIGEKL